MRSRTKKKNRLTHEQLQQAEPTDRKPQLVYKNFLIYIDLKLFKFRLLSRLDPLDLTGEKWDVLEELSWACSRTRNWNSEGSTLMHPALHLEFSSFVWIYTLSLSSPFASRILQCLFCQTDDQTGFLKKAYKRKVGTQNKLFNTTFLNFYSYTNGMKKKIITFQNKTQKW